MLTFNPHIPLALWLPLALAAAVLVVVYAIYSAARLPRARWAWIVGLMSAALAVPLVILLNPMWVEQIPPPPGRPLLTLLVDRSASMATADGDAGSRTRYAVASEIAREAMRELGDEYEIRVRLFDQRSSLTDLQKLPQATPDGPSTSLAAGIDDALGEDRPQGQAILLLSDGIDTSAFDEARLRQAAEKAKALSTPLYVRTLGTQQGVRDLELTLNLAQELAFVAQQVPFVVRLSHTYPAPQTTRLTLSRDGREIESREVNVAAGGFAEEVLYVSQDKSGLYRYEIAAAALDDEVTEMNNAATLLLRVVDQPVAVLLLEGKPYWDSKFLIRTLAADPSMELTSVVQMAPGRFLERRIERTKPETTQAALETPADSAPSTEYSVPGTLPVRSEWKIHTDAHRLLADKEFLQQFQIVVLGRNTEAYLTDEAILGLRGWLQGGDGSLVCFRGSPASQITQRLGALLPVRWSPGRESRFRLSLTDSGQAMQWLPQSGGELALLPSLAASAKPEEPKLLTTVLATGGGEDDAVPLITYRPEGNGRVVVVEGAGMWRWAFLPPEHQDHDAVYGTLWRSLVRWLVSNVGLLPSERVALRPDAVTYAATQAATATLLLRDDQWSEVPQVELSGGELAKPQAVAPVPQGSQGGVYRVNFGSLPEGRYAARVIGAAEEESSAVTTFDVTGNLRERLDIVARPGVLAELARRSGGGVLAADQPDEFPGELNAAISEHRNKSRPQRVIRTAAWDRWWILLAVFGLWTCTWGLRRWSGLI